MMPLYKPSDSSYASNIFYTEFEVKEDVIEYCIKPVVEVRRRYYVMPVNIIEKGIINIENTVEEAMDKLAYKIAFQTVCNKRNKQYKQIKTRFWENLTFTVCPESIDKIICDIEIEIKSKVVIYDIDMSFASMHKDGNGYITTPYSRSNPWGVECGYDRIIDITDCQMFNIEISPLDQK